MKKSRLLQSTVSLVLVLIGMAGRAQAQSFVFRKVLPSDPKACLAGNADVELGYQMPVLRSQGNLGTCYVSSASSVVSAALTRATGKAVSVSDSYTLLVSLLSEPNLISEVTRVRRRGEPPTTHYIEGGEVVIFQARASQALIHDGNIVVQSSNDLAQVQEIDRNIQARLHSALLPEFALSGIKPYLETVRASAAKTPSSTLSSLSVKTYQASDLDGYVKLSNEITQWFIDAKEISDAKMARLDHLANDCLKKSASLRHLMLKALCQGIPVEAVMNLSAGFLGITSDGKKIPLPPDLNAGHAAVVQGYLPSRRPDSGYWILRNSSKEMPILLLKEEFSCHIHSVNLVLTPSEKKLFPN